MSNSCTVSILEYPLHNVKPTLRKCERDGKACDQVLRPCQTCPKGPQLPLFPDSMTHHKLLGRGREYIVLRKGTPHPQSYGVSSAYRVLSPQLLLKRFDQVRDCLQNVLGLTTGQREVTLKLLRLFAYYGQVYPKASLFCQEPGASRATFWRTIKRLSNENLVQVVNRFILRPHAQISNLYRFDKLLLLLARYLAEHGQAFYQKWLKPYLALAGSVFWGETIWLKEAELPPPLLEQRRDGALL